MRAKELADPCRARAIDLRGASERELGKDFLEARTLDDTNRVELGEVRRQHLREPFSQRLELRVLALVVEVEDRHRRGLGARPLRARGTRTKSRSHGDRRGEQPERTPPRDGVGSDRVAPSGSRSIAHRSKMFAERREARNPSARAALTG